MRLFLVFLFGALLGYLTALLLPLLFVTWLQSFVMETREPEVVQCDGGEERCRHGVTPADNCLMCAIEAPDDEPDPAGMRRS